MTPRNKGLKWCRRAVPFCGWRTTRCFVDSACKKPQPLSSCMTSMPLRPPVTNIFFFRFEYSGSMATDWHEEGQAGGFEKAYALIQT